MSNERIDEFLSWRGRLDDPRGVPGQGLDDREATWERLMAKIAGTRRRRRFFGYRAAVACMLLALVPAVGFFYDRHSRVIAVRPVERQHVVAPEALKHSPGAGTGGGAEEHAPDGDAGSGDVAAARMERAQPEVQGRRRVMRKQATRQQPVQIAGLATPPAAMPVKLPDSTSAVTLNTLKNKSLRVVHINELPGGPGPLPAAVTASDAARRFEFFLVPGQSRVALPPPPPAAEAALLKVRLSSSN